MVILAGEESPQGLVMVQFVDETVLDWLIKQVISGLACGLSDHEQIVVLLLLPVLFSTLSEENDRI